MDTDTLKILNNTYETSMPWKEVSICV